MIGTTLVILTALMVALFGGSIFASEPSLGHDKAAPELTHDDL
jgi:hypothetical protein